MTNIQTPGYLKWDGSKYVFDPGTSGGGQPSGPAGGDLSGTYPDPNVAKVAGTEVPSAPSANQILVASNSSQADWALISNANIAPTASIAGSKINPNFSGQVVTADSLSVNSASVSSGTGIPSSMPADGSIYLRKDGYSSTGVYTRQGGSWYELGAGGGGFTAAGDLSGDGTSQTVIGLQGRSLSASAPSSNNVILWNGSSWTPSAVPTQDPTLGGDLSGTASAASVVKIRGISVQNATPTNGQALLYNSSNSRYEPSSIPSGFTAGGDLTGTSSSQTVAKVNGATVPVSGSLTTGNILTVSGASALSYSALNLAGGSNYVTGTLPATNLPDSSTIAKGIVQLSGDIAGTSTAVSVAKINGATVPTSGALTTGNILTVSGSSALSYSALNLAGGSNYVTGTLPATNLPDSSTIAKGIVQLSGDIAGTSTAVSVAKINGATVPTSGALTTGNILTVSGSSALSYSALNLAGGSNYVTGTLPATNLPDASTGAKGIVQLAGDIAGTSTAVSVAKVNGATVPAAGALTTGNSLRVSGASTLTYSALNLAGGSGYVTGTLPATNLPDASTGAKGIVQLAGDIAGTSTAVSVAKVNGATVPAAGALTSGNILQASGASALTYAAITLSNSNSVTGRLSLANFELGTAGLPLVGNAASSSSYASSIYGMISISNRQYDVVDSIYPVDMYTRSYIASKTTTNTTPSNIISITLNASVGISITANATILDGYTGYGGTKRVTNIIKTGLFYRGSSGGATRSEGSVDQYVQSNVNALHGYELNFSTSSNNVTISAKGEARNSNWNVVITINYVGSII